MSNKGYENKPQRIEPDYGNVRFIDEYPELQKKCWLRRLGHSRALGQLALFPRDQNQLLLFPTAPAPRTAPDLRPLPEPPEAS